MQNLSRWISGKHSKRQFFQNQRFSPKMFPQKRRFLFRHLYPKPCCQKAEISISFCQCPWKDSRNNSFFQKSYLSSKATSGHVESNFEHLPKICQKMTKIVSSKFEKDRRKYIFFRNTVIFPLNFRYGWKTQNVRSQFLLIMFLWTRRMQFRQHAVNFSRLIFFVRWP